MPFRKASVRDLALFLCPTRRSSTKVGCSTVVGAFRILKGVKIYLLKIIILILCPGHAWMLHDLCDMHTLLEQVQSGELRDHVYLPGERGGERGSVVEKVSGQLLSYFISILPRYQSRLSPFTIGLLAYETVVIFMKANAVITRLLGSVSLSRSCLMLQCPLLCGALQSCIYSNRITSVYLLCLGPVVSRFCLSSVLQTLNLTTN